MSRPEDPPNPLFALVNAIRAYYPPKCCVAFRPGGAVGVEVRIEGHYARFPPMEAANNQ